MTSLTQTSAKIYQFPVGGRGGPARRERTDPGMEASSANILTCTSWYHEVAMLDEQNSKQL